MFGAGGNDLLEGQDGDDLLFGEDGADTIRGGNGRDVLQGAEGADIISGGDGDDTLQGGALGDRLTGGLGQDKFQYTGVAGGPFGSDGTISATRDAITDFTKGQDKVNVHLIDANWTLSASLDFTFIGSSGFTSPGR